MLQIKDIYSHANIIVSDDQDDYLDFKNALLVSNIEVMYFDTNPEAEDGENKNLNFKIEDVFRIKDFQNSKSSGKRFIITNRSLRNTVVQNALLKILEEPNENVYLVMFTNELSMLLPTIISRCQVLNIRDTKSVEGRLKSISNDKIISKIISNNSEKDRFEKLERYLVIENLTQKGLVSQKQFEDYKALL